MPKVEIGFLRKHWQLIGFLSLLLFQVFLLITGYTFFVVSGVGIHLTTHAVTMLGYKSWQKVLGYRHNRNSMDIVRKPIVEELIKELPSQEKKIRKICKEYITFDRFRYQLEQVEGFSQPLWRHVTDTSIAVKPKVSIVVPIYDISHEILALQVESIAVQTYTNILNVYLVINDGKDIATKDFLENLVSDKYSQSAMKFIVVVEPNPGKRKAQKNGFDECLADGSEITVNMDGDGFADQDQIANLVRIFNSDHQIGLVTGDVRVMNMGFNLLTLIIGLRYHEAFWSERAAQSIEGTMICGSGPNLAIRNNVLAEILDAWFHDEFLGQESNYGDDRDLTLKTMEAGYKTVFVPDSIVHTDAPTKMAEYRKQQLRWNKSAWKYNIKMYQSGLWNRLPIFTKLSVAYLTFYIFIVLAAILSVLIGAGWEAINQNFALAWSMLWPYIVSILFVHWFFFSLPGYWLTGDWRFIFTPVHFLLWVDVQIPAKFISFATLTDNRWGTRQEREVEGSA